MMSEVAVDPEIAELIPNFLLSRSTDVIKMKSFVGQRDFLALSRLCHTIKGVAAPYGFPTLGTLCAQLEINCSKSDDRQCGNIVSQIEQYLEKYRIQRLSPEPTV